MAIYFFSGKETYLKKQEIEKLYRKIECPELNFQHFYEISDTFYDFLFSFPFFGDKKVAVLHFFPDSEDFLEAIKRLPNFMDLYILSATIPDQRKKAVKELMRLVQIKEFEKINEDLLYKCIASRLQRLGYEKDEIESAKDRLIESFQGYFMHSEMNLEIVQKHVNLIAFSGKLNEDNIRAFAPDNSDLRAYRLSTMLLNGDVSCIRFANQLLDQGETAIGLLSLVAYQIRVCYKACLFSEENYLNLIGIRNYQLYKDFKNYTADTYKHVYHILMNGVERVKKGEKAGPIMADCLMESLAILKEEKLCSISY